ncbi:DUF7289 family protein [Halorientalis salina]|uniref:DUF7289 family protein n=1 Tax=Halorientalis salina TaxID=2932266 RepID=UPI0010ABB01A|nr:hypothetical protein [Halorientalis salina]
MTVGGVRRWLSGDSRGQSSPIGYLLVIAVVLAGTITIVALGTSALDSTREQAELQRAEHSMTLFDSRTAMVALGASNTQTISFGQDSGSFTTDPESGWIAIEHHNYSGGENVEVIYNESLGRMLYTNGKTEIAYQGGGVWRKDGQGDALMVSPPEFHYRRATLTLPIIRVRSDTKGSSTAKVTVSQKGPEAPVYPNQTTSTSNGTGAPYDYEDDPAQYENPIENGTVYAWVHSDYYEGWAEYFRQRTTGNVTEYDHNQTVRLELVSFGGAPGTVAPLPDPGGDIEAGGVGEGHPLKEFDVSLDVDKSDPRFSFYATEDGKEFEIYVYSDVKNNPCPDPDGKVYVGVYYHDGDGTTNYEAFENRTAIDPDQASWMDWDCSSDAKLNIDFLNSRQMTYDKLGKDGHVDPGFTSKLEPSSGTADDSTLGNRWAFNDHIREEGSWSLNSTAKWDQHSPTVTDEPSSYTQGDEEQMDEVINHYFQLMGPDVDLIVKGGPGTSDRIQEPTSSASLDYEETKGTEFIAFLHVTENDVQVDFE